ncbi:PREDICTED: uncharacterized protein LOC105360969 [Ceratosolen solmsi marchali]|uniref:Uncharacterized protein LOC105360969 n=1 Tax=Ceratosolen solmsi marchali TaxID=326594 RepID=A0AAJ7DTU7_9HYME|nr:PREDICTED: uncharacterized protein LOC105360969 [Ceratosolen solmsi marchali]
MKGNIILIITGIIVINSCCAVNLQSILRSKRAESDFILRSCTASAQLTRKHRTNDASQLTAKNSNLTKFTSPSLVLSSQKVKNSNVNKYLRNDLRLQTRSKGRHLIDKNTTDTPLGTVDVKTIYKDIPRLFKKKDPLPELDRNSSARNLDTDTPIIVVQSLNQYYIN